MADNLRVFGLNYTGVNGIKLTDASGNVITYLRSAITIDDIAQAIQPTGDIVLNVPYVYGWNNTGIRGYAFYGNKLITGITVTNFPNIYDYAFAGMKGLQRFSAPNIDSFSNRGFRVSQYIFNEDTALTDVDIPNVTNIGANTFRGCTALQHIDLPKVYIIMTSAFYNCRALTSIALPALTTIYSDSTFRGCTVLAAADFGSPATLGSSYTFTDCTSLTALVLRNTESICTLNNINCLSNTPFADGKAGGTLYVPSAMISEYEAATNWSTILGYTNNSIQAIEGSIYETQYADGTLIS